MPARIALAAAKSGRPISAHRRRLGVAATVLASATMFFSQCALADESGVSFWVPGFFGSLAAAPQQQGWSLANIYYHTSVSAGGDVAVAREFQIGHLPANVTLTARLNASVNATGDLGFVIPTYVFATPVLGGQASVSLVSAYGVVDTTLSGQLAVASRARRDLTASTIRHGVLAIWSRNSLCVGMPALATTWSISPATSLL